MVWLSLFVVFVLGTAVLLLARRASMTGERLSRVESCLASVLEGPDAGLAVWEENGRLVACNQRFREFYPGVQLKPGLVFEDLARFTATRGLVQLPEDSVETWVDDRVSQFGEVWHDVLRTADGRWLEIDTRPTGAGEVILLYADTTEKRQTEATLSDRGERLQRQSVGLLLLCDAIRISSTATSPEAATADVVARICTWAGWPVGYAYRVSGVGQDLVLDPLPDCYVSLDAEDALGELRGATTRQQLRVGEGVAGRALQAGDIAWVPNIAVDPSIDDVRRSAMPGIRGVCAVPVKREGNVVAVLEFLSRDQLVPDPAVAQILAAASQTLGSVFRIESP